LKPRFLTLKPRGLLPAVLGSALVSAGLLVLSFVLPRAATPTYYPKSLALLRADAQRIRSRFEGVLASMDARRGALDGVHFPADVRQAWSGVRSVALEPDVEGLSLHTANGHLVAWAGNTPDIEPLFEDDPGAFPPPDRTVFIVKDKASVYLVSVLKTPEGGRLALFRLLAFLPPIKSPYLREYQFLDRALLRNADIDYWDYRDDVSGFEKIFSRHQDEYIGQPRQRDDVPSLIIPLRPGPGQILATVSLSAPSPKAYISAGRARWLLASEVCLLLSLVLLLIFLSVRLFRSERSRPLLTLAFTGVVVALRLAVFLLSRLDGLPSLTVFSSASASFFSWSFLTRSPADILFSSLALLLLVIAWTRIGRRTLLRGERRPGATVVVLAGAAAGFVSVSLSAFLLKFFSAAVMNSNLNLLGFSLSLPFLFLFLSLFAVTLAFLFAIWLPLRAVVVLRPGSPLPLLGMLAGLGAFAAAFNVSPAGFSGLALVLAPVALAATAAFFPASLGRLERLWLGLGLAALWACLLLNADTQARDRGLVERTLKSTVLSQETWAGFFLEESLADVDNQAPALLAFLKKPDGSALAHLLWERTSLAKANWYSSLEILRPEGAVLSRFSLNLPLLFQPTAPPSAGKGWSITRTIVSSMGRDKEYLVAAKDWTEAGTPIGRTVLSASLDYEMLPFLYSATPYFELLRARSLPSLQPFNLRFAAFDERGELVFNPDKLTRSIPPELLARIKASPGGTWSKWVHRRTNVQGFFFTEGRRIFAFFIPVKLPLTLAVEFLKLFFLALAAVGLPALLLAALFGRTSLKRYFWSFSNRVYLALLASAVIPLLLFTLSTHGFFSRIFSQQFTDEAEIQADFARNVMGDYFYAQPLERRTPEAPPEDLVLWISSTIGNDVNLYQDGRLVSSSRSEFFDAGLLPDLIDGDTYYSLVVARNPLVTQRRSIGDYSIHTLTIPYALSGETFLISLPFPFEQQEIATATGELLEFLLFLFAFVLGLVALFARNLRTMIVAPIRQLLDATREAGRGNLDIRLEHKPNDEMKTLVEGFNAMVLNLKRHQQELAEMSQKAAWAEMARKVAHEIKNPLTPIQLSAEHLLRVYADRRGDFGRALKESTDYIIGEVENLRRIAQEFLESSRESAVRRDPVDLRDVVRETVAPYKIMLAGRVGVLESYGDVPLVCRGDKSQLKMAVRNILINAIEAMPGRGELGLALGRSGEAILLEVRDTGTGMDPETLDRAFEPSFSTKAAGAGLGLPIAKKIIEDHGGSIRIASAPGRGTKVTILLPGDELEKTPDL
jgi:signal transduction histidine kinase